MSYLKIGNSTFTTNEVNLAHIDTRLALSQRGKRKEQIVTWYLIGEIYDTGSSLVSSINDRRNTFANADYKSASFYLDDGTLAHQLDNNSSLSGVHVVRVSFPKAEPEELATQRTYGVTLQATYPAAETELLFWRESLQFLGTTDPDVIWTYNGPISTGIPNIQTMVQSGYAIGYSGYLSPPGPIYPNYEDRRLRMVQPISGTQRGQAATDFGITWRYVHRAISPMDTYPTTR